MNRYLDPGAAPLARRRLDGQLAAHGGRRGRLLILTENFYPTDSSGGRLMTALAGDLVRRGYEVSVLASRGNYRGQRRVAARSTHEGISIRRLPSGPFSRDRPIGRLVNELVLSVGMFFALLTGPRYERILVTSSPPLLAPLAALAATLRRARLVYVVMDVYPEMAAATGLLRRGSPAYRLWDAISRFALRRASRLVVLGRCMSRLLREKLGGSHPPVAVLPNWADGDEILPVDRHDNRFLEKYPGLRGKFIVQYSGNFGRFHDFETVLRAAERLEARDDVAFVFIGHGARRDWLEKEIESRSLSNVTLLPFQPQEDLVHSLAAQDLALVTLEPGTEGLCVPSKFYPVLAAGRPVIAVMEPAAEVARVVEEERIGVVVEQGDVERLVATIERLSRSPQELREMGDRAREVQQRRFDRSIAVERYLELLDGLSLPAEAR